MILFVQKIRSCLFFSSVFPFFSRKMLERRAKKILRLGLGTLINTNKQTDQKILVSEIPHKYTQKVCPFFGTCFNNVRYFYNSQLFEYIFKITSADHYFNKIISDKKSMICVTGGVQVYIVTGITKITIFI